MALSSISDEDAEKIIQRALDGTSYVWHKPTSHLQRIGYKSGDYRAYFNINIAKQLIDMAHNEHKLVFSVLVDYYWNSVVLMSVATGELACQHEWIEVPMFNLSQIRCSKCDIKQGDSKDEKPNS